MKLCKGERADDGIIKWSWRAGLMLLKGWFGERSGGHQGAQLTIKG